jgi:tetratricopeptide (TPR) repeat protein
MRIVSTLLIAFIVLVTTIVSALAQNTAKDLARGAFYAIEATPFDRELVTRAMAAIQRAANLNAMEPWVAIAVSRAFLEMGYQKGNRYHVGSFAAEALEQAEAYAKQGVALGPTESVAYSQLARIQIILQNYRTAWDTLTQAHTQDTKDFYPWYLRGVLAIRMKDTERAKAALDEAEQHAAHLYQRRFVVQERIGLARLWRDKEAEEHYYKQAIVLDPQDAHAHGNYGNFLLLQKPYDEAIASLEQALAISPYPLAEELLQRARLLRKSAPK